MILALRTDKPQAELYIYKGSTKLGSVTWQAHRELSSTILLKIDDLLSSSNLSLTEVKSLVVYRGPGSFTGLRIGISVFNTISFIMKIPLIGVTGEGWLEVGLQEVSARAYYNNEIITPEYGADAHITQPRK